MTEIRRVLSATLIAHPASDAGPGNALDATITWEPRPRCLTLDYRLRADPARLRVPAPAAPRRVDGLWHHTCFEAFIRPAGAEGYFEFNFSPSGEWAAYRFAARRAGMQPLPGCDDLVPVPSFADDGLALQVSLDLSALPHEPLHLGLAAVVESRDGTLGYWALRHAAAAPDFHDPESFTLRLGQDTPGPAA